MIPRYTLPEMASVWDDSHRLEIWRKVEALSLEAWSDLGVAPAAAAKAAWEAELPTAAALAERERVTDHDLAAFVDRCQRPDVHGGAPPLTRAATSSCGRRARAGGCGTRSGRRRR